MSQHATTCGELPVSDLGGKTIVPPTEVAGGAATIAYFMDPEGHVIGLSGGHR
jgi:predicted enzyme related to lactoylglutathione lyase